MDKNEIIKQVKQYGYTYVVKYKYHEDSYETIGYYCSDSYEFPTEKEIEDHFEFEEGDEYEIINQVANEFNFDDYLSDTIIWMLEGDCKNQDLDYTKYSVAYIYEIYNSCWFDKKEGGDYKKQILTSVLKYLDLRKNSPMTTYVVGEIFYIFNIEKDNNYNIRKQIELIIDPQANGVILYKLAKKEYAKVVQHHLDKIGKVYDISEEKSQYRIGILFLLLFDAFSKKGFLQPQLIDESGKNIRNFTKFMGLMADYYGLTPPTYREQVLRKYKEKGAEKTLIILIKKEHMDVWYSLM